MQSSLKKTLYLGLAAISLGAAAGFATPAQAASHATITSKAALGDKAANVTLTGSNAIYSKPGTVKGAKVVASKATVKALADSKKSSDYFRAYYTATTNKGSIYYKVVSMGGKYRGYIYGGKTAGEFQSGLVQAVTMKTAEMPKRTTGFYLKDITKHTLWTTPKYSEYKGAKKLNMYGVTAKDTFKVTKAATMTREGWLYYFVTSEANPAISGWIFAGKGYDAAAKPEAQDLGGLALVRSDAAATNDNSVKVVYRDKTNQAGTATWVNAPKTATEKATKAGDAVNADAVNSAKVTLKDFIVNSVPAGFTTTGTVPVTGTYGNTVYVDVVAAATSKIELKVDQVNNKLVTRADTAAIKVSNPLTVGTKLSASDLSVTLSADAIKALSGSKGTQFAPENLKKISDGLTSTTVQGSKTYYDQDGKAYHYAFTFEGGDLFKSDNRTKNYGDVLTATFSAQLVANAASTNTSDSSWIAQ